MPHSNRRDFIRTLAAGSLAVSTTSFAADAPATSHTAPAPTTGGPYPYLGRTTGVPDWRVVESGRTIEKIETFSKGAYALVRVTTNDNLEGWGQVAPYDHNISTLSLHQQVARHVIGRDIADIDAINDRVIDATMKFPGATVCRGLGGVDTAIWDLYGKITGKPVCELLGGSVKAVPAYGSSQRRDITPEDEATRLVKLRDTEGFDAFKIRLGIPTGHNSDAAPGRTEQIIPVMRKAMGDKIILKADANSCYTPDKAIEIGRRLEQYGYSHYEEPCPYWEIEWTKEVTEALAIPVAGGEQDTDLGQWRRMMALGVTDIFQPDICYVGGLTRAMRVARMAQSFKRTVTPHAANLSLVTVFTAHMLAAIPNAGHLEFSIEYDSGLTKQALGMFSPALKIEEGKLKLTAEPGWGIRIHPEWLKNADYRITTRADFTKK